MMILVHGWGMKKLGDENDTLLERKHEALTADDGQKGRMHQKKREIGWISVHEEKMTSNYATKERITWTSL